MIWFSLLALLSMIAETTSDGAVFVFPPNKSMQQYAYGQNMVFFENELITVRWTNLSNSGNATLYLFLAQTAPPYLHASVITQENLNPDNTSVRYNFSTAYNLTKSPVFIFLLSLPADISNPIAVTDPFNISASAEPIRTSSTSTSPISIAPAVISASYPTITNIYPTPVTILSSAGLSTGTKAGIGIGVPAAVVIGFLAGWFLIRRYRSQSPVPEQSDYRESWKPELSAESPMSPQVHHELLGESMQDILEPHELHGTGVSEWNYSVAGR